MACNAYVYDVPLAECYWWSWFNPSWDHGWHSSSLGFCQRSAFLQESHLSTLPGQF